jgi:Tfp pilus assembly protein PilV
MGPTHGLRRHSHARCAGVTLTEVVVASTLLLISIIPLLKALTTTHGMDRAIERKSWSLLLAQQELEHMRARSIYHYDESFQASSQALQDGFLCTVADDGHSSLRTVTVAVGFDLNGDGVLATDEIEASLTTCLARRWPGPQ